MPADERRFEMDNYEDYNENINPEEQGDDYLIEELLRKLTPDDEAVKILNFKKYACMYKSAETIEKILISEEMAAKGYLKINTLTNSASLIFELDELTVENTADFAQVVKSADNFEIYPLTNGKIRFSITYQSVLRNIK